MFLNNISTRKSIFKNVRFQRPLSSDTCKIRKDISQDTITYNSIYAR